MVPLYGLGKMHPFSQVGEGCARNRLDYCDHSPPWPGALGQGKKKKGLDSPSTDFPKTSHKKQKQNKKPKPNNKSIPLALPSCPHFYKKLSKCILIFKTHTYTHPSILVKRRKVTTHLQRNKQSFRQTLVSDYGQSRETVLSFPHSALSFSQPFTKQTRRFGERQFSLVTIYMIK